MGLSLQAASQTEPLQTLVILPPLLCLLLFLSSLAPTFLFSCYVLWMGDRSAVFWGTGAQPPPLFCSTVS